MIASARPCTPILPGNLHGKEGLDGSSPSEGSAKDAKGSLQDLQYAMGVESRFMSFQV